MTKRNSDFAKSRQQSRSSFTINEVSIESDKFIVFQIVTYLVTKRNTFAIADGRDIDTSLIELVDEGLIVIGAHGTPAFVMDIGIEYSQSWKVQKSALGQNGKSKSFAEQNQPPNVSMI